MGNLSLYYFSNVFLYTRRFQYMTTQKILGCSLEITLNARMRYSFKHWIYKYFKIILCCSLLITMITGMTYFFMNWVYMLFKIRVSCCLVITMIAGKTDALMNHFIMTVNVWYIGKLFITFATCKLLLSNYCRLFIGSMIFSTVLSFFTGL